MLRAVRRKPRSLRSPFLPLVTATIDGRLLLSTLPSTQSGAPAHYQTAILPRRIVAPQDAAIFLRWRGPGPCAAATDTTLILRCSPAWASLEGWRQTQSAR